MEDADDAAAYAARVGFGPGGPAASQPRHSPRFPHAIRKATPPPMPPDAARECGRCDQCGTPLYLRAPPGAVSAKVEWWCNHRPHGPD